MQWEQDWMEFREVRWGTAAIPHRLKRPKQYEQREDIAKARFVREQLNCVELKPSDLPSSPILPKSARKEECANDAIHKTLQYAVLVVAMNPSDLTN